MKEEIQKQLSVGFLSMVEYPKWMDNVVPVLKKDDKVRVYVDFEISIRPILMMIFLFLTLTCQLQYIRSFNVVLYRWVFRV